MIDDIARSLAAAVPDCTAEEIADILWLARLLPAGLGVAEGPDSGGTMPSPPGTGVAGGSGMLKDGRAAVVMPHGRDPVSAGRTVAATPVGLRAPASVSRPLPTARALSLFKRISGPGVPEIDIDATVEATADTRRLTIVTKPGRERGLDVALIADTSPAMSACSNLLTEFEMLLVQAGAFRSVSRWTLVPGTEVTIRDHARVEHPPGRLIDPSGRRLVLLVTDATADHWYHPAIWHTLRRWAEVMPTAVVHILPERYRAQGPLGSDAITMRSRRPGDPNRAAAVEVAWWDMYPDPGDRVPVPVIGLHPSALATWAQAVVAGTDWVDAVWASRPQGRTTAREANLNLSAQDRVRAFQSKASRGAQALARILAGAPILSLPLIGVLQARLLPHTGASELAEVLVSGLLEQASASAEENEQAQFRFRPSAGELLRRGITATQEWDTFEAISEYLEQHAGTGNAIHALLASPGGLSSVDAELEPFAALGQSVAARLGLVPAASAVTSTGDSGEHTEKPAPSPPAPQPSELAPALGVSIGDEALERALTHRSYTYEHEGLPTNERLEFLGDAVLGLIVTDRLFRQHPQLPAGQLARLRASIVRMTALAGIARQLGLGTYIRLGRTEESTGGRDKPSILADTLAAVIGAVYLDSGLEQAVGLVNRLFDPVIQQSAMLGAGLDWKTSLQELTAANLLGIPEYHIVDSGPDHKKSYHATVIVDGQVAGIGEGRSKRLAEQQAAEAAWRAISSNDRRPSEPA